MSSGKKLERLSFPKSAVVGQSDQARCFLIDDKKIWIPKSLITEWDDSDGVVVTFLCQQWKVEDLALEPYIDNSDVPSLFD